jgi:hypothetical protein
MSLNRSGVWRTSHKSMASCMRSQLSGVVSSSRASRVAISADKRHFSRSNSDTDRRLTPRRSANSAWNISSAGSTSSLKPRRRGAWAFGWGLEAIASGGILKIHVHRVLAVKFEGKAPVAGHRDRIGALAIPLSGWNSKPGSFISSGLATASKRSSMRSIRGANLPGIPPQSPLTKKRSRPRCRNLRITLHAIYYIAL